MRPGIIIGITIILFVSLQGCGRKAPLKLPDTLEQASTIDKSDNQKPGVPVPAQGKES